MMQDGQVWNGSQWVALEPGTQLGTHVWTGGGWAVLHPSDTIAATPEFTPSSNPPEGQESWLKSNNKLVLLGGGLAVLVVLGLLFALAGNKTHDVAGTFEFSGEYGSCQGSGGYSDIGSGTEATLYSGSGEVLASTELGIGSEQSGYCEFTFTFNDVPETDFYQFEVGDRGKLKVSLDEMKANGWSVGGSLG